MTAALPPTHPLAAALAAARYRADTVQRADVGDTDRPAWEDLSTDRRAALIWAADRYLAVLPDVAVTARRAAEAAPEIRRTGVRPPEVHPYAARLAAALQNRAAAGQLGGVGGIIPAWDALSGDEQEWDAVMASHYLHALIAVVPQLDAYLSGGTAMMRAHKSGGPVPRDEYAASLTVDADMAGERRALVTEGEATAIAYLLDELMGVYPDGDPVGCLARRLAVLLWDRMGI